ncbi:MAG: hypothetical protein ACTSXD_11605 [Candidatus Heimdallarchaeaceae archaeon]
MGLKQKIKEELEKALKELEELEQKRWVEIDIKKEKKKWYKINERIRILRKLLKDDEHNLSKKGEELKTLQDLFGGYWFVPELRKEAIKWVKEFRKSTPEGMLKWNWYLCDKCKLLTKAYFNPGWEELEGTPPCYKCKKKTRFIAFSDMESDWKNKMENKAVEFMKFFNITEEEIKAGGAR